MLTPYAPHVAEELYNGLQSSASGYVASVLDAPFPVYDAKYLIESSKEYPVSINGKLRTTITLPMDITKEAVEETVLANDTVKKWVENKPVKKVIYVQGKMVNVVV